MGLGCKLRGLRAELLSLRFPMSDLHDFMEKDKWFFFSLEEKFLLSFFRLGVFKFVGV